jgi:hypothetical protein
VLILKKVANSENMTKSALEQELIQKLKLLKTDISVHDRAVLLGFLFSVLPIFPVAFLGLIFSLFNLYLYKHGKLELHELKLIRWGIGLGVFNSTLGFLLIVFMGSYLLGLDWQFYFHETIESIKRIISKSPFGWLREKGVYI